MKKYIIAITLFCLSLFLIDNAYAATQTNVEGLSVPNNLQGYNCSSSSTCNGSLTLSANYANSWPIYSANVGTLYTAGYYLAMQSDVWFDQNNLYSVSALICYSSGHAYNVDAYSSNDYDDTFPDMKYSNSQATWLDGTVTLPDGGESYNANCVQYTSLIVPKTSGSWFHLHITSSTRFNDVTAYLYGIKVEGLGIYNGTIQDIINRSGFATANSVSEIEQSQQEIKQEITGMQEKQDETNTKLDETKEQIKEGFENCRDSVNLLNVPQTFTVNGYYDVVSHLEPGTYTLYASSVENNSASSLFLFNVSDRYIYLSSSTLTKTFELSSGSSFLRIFSGSDYSSSSGITATFKDLMLVKGSAVPSSYEPYGEQVCTNRIDETNDKLDNLNDNITNSDSSGATNSAGSFFEGFNTDTFGLTSIITAPLNLIKSITSKTCTPLNLQIPFVNKNMQLPCMTTIYTNYFGSFLTIYQTITFGIISYWVCIRIFALVKDFKNPDHDEIEVMDL